MQVVFYSSAFCEPCMQTRSLVAQAVALVPQATLVERDVARFEGAARADQIRSTPTVLIRSAAGAEVFRAEGVPTLNQVLVAMERAL